MPAGKKQADAKPEAAEESVAPAVPAAGEFPKYVKGFIFKSRAEQDAAGPDYADGAK